MPKETKMSDEARDAHLDWLDEATKQNVDDYEAWLEERVAQLEAEIALKADYIKRLEVENEELETQLSLSISMYEGDRSPMHNLQIDNALLEAKLTAIECGDCHKTMLECACDDLENG